MKIILKEAIKGVGRPGEAVEVADGYARNYLLPKRLAELATPAKLKEWEFRRGKVEKKLAEERAVAEGLATQLAAKPIEITARSGEEGKLFGSVTNKDVAEAIQIQLGLEVDRKKIEMSEPIKSLGDHSVAIDLHVDVTATVTVRVTGENGETAESVAAAAPAEEPSAEEGAEEAGTEAAESE